MYFLFVTLVRDDQGLKITPLVLPLRTLHCFEGAAELFLWSVLDTLSEASDAEKHLKKTLERHADIGTPLQIETALDLFFIWTTCEAARPEDDPNEEAEIRVWDEHGTINLRLNPQEDFAIVLATRHQDEAEQLLDDLEEIQRLVYGEAEAEAEDESAYSCN